MSFEPCVGRQAS